MQYRIVPSNGDRLSVLGFGCMRFPERRNRIDIDQARPLLTQALDAGVNYFDTALFYHHGQSESFLGETLAQAGVRDKVYIATKLPPWKVHSRADMDKILNTQLRRLRTDHIDYYMLHALNGGNWDAMVAMDVQDFLDRAVRDGRIVNVGFSFHGDLPAFKRIVDAGWWSFCQIQYNYLDTHYQAGCEGLDYAARQKMAVMVMEPLRGGELAGAMPPAVRRIFDRSDRPWSAAGWALRWLWNHPAVTVVLSGMRSVSDLQDNLASADDAADLTDTDLAVVDRAAALIADAMAVPCTGCGYCMPCPAGVDIPGCFALLNRRALFGARRMYWVGYLGHLGGLTGSMRSHWAGQCTRCGPAWRNAPSTSPFPTAWTRSAAVSRRSLCVP